MAKPKYEFGVKYFVNEEKKIVVCKFIGCGYALNHDMRLKGYPCHPDFEIDDVIIGKAKCSEEDTFDVEIGKKIAYKRAYAKLVEKKSKALSRFIDANNKFMADLNAIAGKMTKVYSDIIDAKQNDIQHIIATVPNN